MRCFEFCGETFKSGEKPTHSHSAYCVWQWEVRRRWVTVLVCVRAGRKISKEVVVNKGEEGRGVRRQGVCSVGFAEV